MLLNTNDMVSISEANQNFSKVASKVDKSGSVVVLKNNKPRYLIIDLNSQNFLNLSDDEKVEVVAKRILREHKHAFEVLGQ